MKPAPFEYRRPGSVDEALDVLAEHGEDARVLAGGQSLLPLMNLRLATPAVLVDIGRLDSLRMLSRAPGSWRVGAMVTQAMLESAPGLPPAVVAALPTLAHIQIRTRSTVGGSLAHLDPAAEWPALALALDATITVRSRRGSRSIAARDFVAAPYAPMLDPDELVTEIGLSDRIERQGFIKISRRPGDFALGGAVLAWPQGQAPRVVLFGIGPIQQRLRTLEDALRSGIGPGPELRALVAREAEGTADVHATAEYRVRLAAILVDRLVASACA